MRIPRFISRSLVIEAIIIILLASITPALIVGYLTFSGAKEALQKAELDSLCTARDRGKEAIQDYLDESVRDLRLLARTWSVRHVCKTLPILGVEWQKSEQVAETLNSAKYKGLTADINDVLNSWLNLYESDNAYHDVLIILGRERGRVMYTQKRGADFGAVLDPQADSSSPLARLWSRVVETQKTVMVDFSHYDPIRGVAAFIGTPVRHEQGALIGVLVVRIGTERIDRIMKGIAQIAKTGNAFIFGNDLLLRSNDRFHDASILKRKVGFKEARAALEGKSGIGEMVNREGVAHLIAWSPVGLKGRKNLGSDFDWAIVGEVASTEAFGPVYTLRTRAILITISIGLLLSGIVFLITRPTVSTVVRLSDQVSRITEGDLTTEVPSSERADEIGVLARNFRQMVGNLREQTGAFLKGITTLKSSASTIAQTVSHLADSTSSTSGAVTETFATVEQTKQAAQLSSEKANKVLADSMNSVQISEGGRQATSATILKMNAIKANVASIGETVLRLSEQSRAISDIAVAAQDLADQSNLLAVNASIEAARAGEQGKGFAVVAQEIKSLADQSKAATQQIRSIIEETGKWVEAVVVATKGGGAAVDEGVSQSMAAGEAIEALAKSVQEASMAVTVIDSTTKQQFSGMNQISDAMTHIDESMKRNLLATDELGTLARELEALSAKLDQLMGRYKV